MVKAREIAETLKGWIKDRKFFLNQPAQLLPDADVMGGDGSGPTK
jgi:hypothetical protein